MDKGLDENLEFILELEFFDVVPNDEVFTVEPYIPEDEPRRNVKSQTEVRVPVYAKKIQQ